MTHQSGKLRDPSGQGYDRPVARRGNECWGGVTASEWMT